MSLLNSFIALAIVLFAIAFCGHMTFKSANRSNLEGTEMNISWLTSAFVLWIIALSTPYADRVLALMIIGGPIAFIMGFLYVVSRGFTKKRTG